MHLNKIFFIALFIFSNFIVQAQPTIAFLDAFKDETLDASRKGFFDALAKNGFSEKEHTLKVIYRNAQGDIPLLVQAVDYFNSQEVKFIATCPSISTITAMQHSTLPVCMMVSPSPQLAGLADANGNVPSRLFGAYETLSYIDTAVSLIKQNDSNIKKLGLLYNQSEPQSLSAYEHIQSTCKSEGIELIALPANNSSETQQIVQVLLSKNIDAFFAMPDNTVFASFEVILKECKKKSVPIYTSEAGLYARGADAAFGADMYQWGFQAGIQAASFLKSNVIPAPELVTVRKKLIRKTHETATEKVETVTHHYLFDAIIFALTFCGLCIGLYISMNVFNLPDITTDGSFTLGAAVTAVLMMQHISMPIIILCVLFAGAIAGMCTAFIHTQLKVNALLAGIITMTALYSVNLLIMGKSNLPLINLNSLFEIGVHPLLLTTFISLLIIFIIDRLLHTDFGIAMRATGANESMVRAQGVNSNKMKIVGLALANSLTAFSGFMVTQYQGFADINMGIGIVIFGLGSVMIGNTIYELLKLNNLFFRLIFILLGAVLFRIVLALALSFGADPSMLKLITAAMVLLIVALPRLKKSN
jgi:ABC-type uncharacterized transport system permease subunit/ABC-type uncharacterized transport system substrate-binding protein